MVIHARKEPHDVDFLHREQEARGGAATPYRMRVERLWGASIRHQDDRHVLDTYSYHLKQIEVWSILRGVHIRKHQEHPCSFAHHRTADRST